MDSTAVPAYEPRGLDPAIRLLLVFLASLLYPLAATLNPVLRQSPLAVAVLTGLVLAVGLQMALSRSRDIFEPIKMLGFYFLVIYAIAPLGFVEQEWDYVSSLPEALPPAALFVLAAYGMTLAGHSLSGLFGRADGLSFQKIRSACAGGSSHLVAIGAIFYVVGLIGYLVLFVRVGGVETILYSDVNRAEFFVDVGYLFWVAAFMFPGSLLLFLGSRERLGTTRLVRYLPAVSTFLLFIVLQGRARALNALLLALFAAHYVVKPVKLRQLAIYGSGVVLLAIFVGMSRASAVRYYAASDPLAILTAIFSDFFSLLGRFATIDLARIRQVALVLEKVPSVESYDWGSSLVVFLNPWLRLVGMSHLTLEEVGTRLFHLAMPHLPHMNTGIQPSLAGEMLFNFPWWLAAFPFFLFGFFATRVYHMLLVRRPTALAVAAQAALGVWYSQFMLSGFGKSVFEMMIWLAPIGVAWLLSTLFASPPASVGSAGSPTSPGPLDGREAV